MTAFYIFFLTCLSFLLFPSFCLSASATLDTFDGNDTMSWRYGHASADQPWVVLGGPGGSEDYCLQWETSGAAKQGGRWHVINDEARWNATYYGYSFFPLHFARIY